MPRNEVANIDDAAASLIPESLRDDLLASQAEQITTAQRIPRVKILPAGVGQYEFDDEPEGSSTRTFEAVILHTHPKNVMWDKPFGEGEEDEGPACGSHDGLTGVPRPGFEHMGIAGDHATGDEVIECGTCPYNQWGSKELLGQEGKGKACTNQRAVFLQTDDRRSPCEMVLSPTSISPLDDYLTGLLNRGVPMQAVKTTFGQEIQTRGQLRWATATFEVAEQLDNDTLTTILAIREEYRPVLFPEARQ